MSDWQRFIDVLAQRNAEGWPTAYMPRGMPARSDYLPREFESGHVRRDANGEPVVRLVDAGDRLAFFLPDVGGALVNPKGPGLRAIGLVTTYARGSKHHASAYRAADLSKGRPVESRREPNNPHDRNAIALHEPGARKPFAYVQRGRAPALAKRADSGERLAGVCLWGPGPGRDDDSAFILVGSVSDLSALLR